MSNIQTDADLLYGVPAIALHLNMSHKQVYHLHAKAALPTFKVGKTVCARRSALAGQFAEQEVNAHVRQGNLQIPLSVDAKPVAADTRNDPDLLYGVEQIANHLHMTRRQVYHLHDQARIPTFKLGGKVCAQRSGLTAYFAERESGGQLITNNVTRPRRYRTRGRPASVIVGVERIAVYLCLNVDEVIDRDRLRLLPTYIADGIICALGAELDHYINTKGER